MIMANAYVGKRIYDGLKDAAILRRHPAPNPGQFEMLVKAAESKVMITPSMDIFILTLFLAPGIPSWFLLQQGTFAVFGDDLQSLQKWSRDTSPYEDHGNCCHEWSWLYIIRPLHCWTVFPLWFGTGVLYPFYCKYMLLNSHRCFSLTHKFIPASPLSADTQMSLPTDSSSYVLKTLLHWRTVQKYLPQCCKMLK